MVNEESPLYREQSGFVKGRDFSRAKNAQQAIGALVPERRIFEAISGLPVNHPQSAKLEFARRHSESPSRPFLKPSVESRIAAPSAY